MNTERALSWVGTALQIGGAAMLASRLGRPVDAYLVMLLGAAVWVEVASRRRDWPLLTMQTVFFALNGIGAWRWWE